MQWATASYACPRFEGALTGSATAATADEALVPMPDCHGDASAMDPAQPQLCKAHCEAGQQSVNSGAGALDVPPALTQAGGWAGVLDTARVAELAAAVPPMLGAPPPAGAPPLYLSLLVLRN